MNATWHYQLTLAPGPLHWLILSSLLFSIGIYGMLTRRSAVGILVGLELCLNSGALNFIMFNHFYAPGTVDGQLMAAFIVATAAAEVVMAMAILVSLYKFRQTSDVTRFSSLKEQLSEPLLGPLPGEESRRG